MTLRKLETHRVVLQSAAHDAINRFIRDALIPLELVDKDKYYANEREIDLIRHTIEEEVVKGWEVAWINDAE